MSFLWRDFARNVSSQAHYHPAVGLRAYAMARRDVLAVGLTLTTAAALTSLPLHHALSAVDANADGAKQFITDLANKAIGVMSDKSLGDKDRVQKFHDLFIASFDLPTIGQHVLGRYWRNASPAQQAQFLKLFEEQEVLVWSTRFKSYNGEKLAVQSADAGEGGTVKVESQINRPSGEAIPLEWIVAQSGGNWRISDITVEGASMALTLRQDFGSVIESHGGKVDALLTAMQKKIDQLRSTG
ncbi:MAG TPA: ABC transporter substrate-binding protein [Magnetospirillaceae bacterium]|jgi:phospholipid transport system substrate-binding protein